MKEKLISAMKDAIMMLERHPSRDVLLIHHNDTDGLSSGAILKNSFGQAGYKPQCLSLEKPYPQVLEKILAPEGRIIVLADFAGKIAPLISELNQGRNLVIILDHHPAERVEDPTVFNLDGALYGLRGDQDISASATCYLFADQLLKSAGFDGTAYSHLGVLGAVGDGFFVDGALSGVNREILETALNLQLVRVLKKNGSERYHFTIAGKEYADSEICRILDTVGGVGYYSGGAEKGVHICSAGVDRETSAYIESLVKQKDAIFGKEIERLRSCIRSTKHVQWFDVEDRFQPMGIKMIGVFCTCMKDLDFLDKTKYLAGFQHIPDMVPGFGEISFDATKISMRVSEYLTGEIRAGKMPGLDTFLPEATSRLGGFSDACHGLSAATTVNIGDEELLIEEMERILSRKEGLK